MKLQSALRSMYNTAKLLLDENVILATWWNRSWWEKENWGDALNPILIQNISGKKPLLVTRYTHNVRKKPIYSVIGSILDGEVLNNCGSGDLVVWGTGFISSQGRLKVQPKEICAVRGPLTRELLLKQGYNCPEIYGDPALLYPRFYKPRVQKRYKLGIIPHFADQKHKFLSNFQNDPNILIIDILGGIHNVVDQICNCQKIASSSLHGIIAADAYGVQSTWIELPGTVIGGDGFKFFDYFESVGRIDEGPLIIQENSSIEDILDTYDQYKLNLDLNELWDACPFRHN